ncbi:TIR domain-containing protein [Mycobacterium malmoense]|uniref:TIR domain-containing protein n=1 Tax=Mycobacterium malmoense TaxID=1780 RepID=UPI0008F8A09A|nr:nucleotide-binding protein [Mycobacterium malmoense]OIN79103.1 hypothetical protein BMG05_19870 [Mycobacterium malmoense]
MKIITAQKLVRIDEQIAAARNGEPVEFEAWRATAEVVLRYAVGDGDQLVADFRDVRYGPAAWTNLTPPGVFAEAQRDGVREGIALLQAARTKVEILDEQESTEEVSADISAARSEIFIVHGRDDGQKEAVARLVQGLTKREPVILHEQASGSDTVIEKLERISGTAAFAIVIATGDDVGRLKDAAQDQDCPRARQNVILELGYFFGLLGRRNVLLLFEPGIDRPTDTDGIMRIELDTGRGWRIELANELEQAGFEVDRKALR